MAVVTGQKLVPPGDGDDDGVLGHEGDGMDLSAEHQSLVAKSKATIFVYGGTQLQTNLDLYKNVTISSVNNESVSDSKIAHERVSAEIQVEKIDVEMALVKEASSTPLRAASAKSAPEIAEPVKHQEKAPMEELGGSSEVELCESSKRALEQVRLPEELQNDKKRALELPTESTRESRKMRTTAEDEEEKKKKIDEEGDNVCFICFDGGDLVLCDRKACTKAYHLSCIRRDEAFFKKKGAWLCGWHFCSACAKPGENKNFWQCYTCPTAYCGMCFPEHGVKFLAVCERKGLCVECLPIATMIERNETVTADGVEVNFNDPETYECLFKDYWQDLKRKVSLVMPELDKDGKSMDKNSMDEDHHEAEESKSMDEDHTGKEEKSMDEDHAGKEEKSMDEDHEAEEKSVDEDHAGNSTEYAAITPKNIDLIYLKRAVLRELLDDPEFHNKVVGTFVRIRVPRTYRLVQVTGTRTGEESYKAGSTKTTNIILELLNLQKKEEVTVNAVSDLDFTEEECQRLRQSIKYGFIKAMTVSEVEAKAMVLREHKLNLWFESEKERMMNLRDRASEKGRKKELRECVEKLQELSDPEFRAAKLEEAMPEVTADPHVDPKYESDVNDTRKDSPHEVRDSKATRTGFNTSENTSLPSLLHVRGDYAHYKSKNSWEDHGRRGYYDGGRSAHQSGRTQQTSKRVTLPELQSSEYQSRDQDRIRGVDNNWGGKGGRTEADPWVDNWGGKGGRTEADPWVDNWGGKGGRTEADPWEDNRGGNGGRIEADPWAADNWGGEGGPIEVDPWVNNSNFCLPEPALGSRETRPERAREVVSSEATVNVRTQSVVMSETEKMWHYQDPSGVVQGPFSMEKLREWSTTGLFPADLTIWKTDDNKENSEVLLTDAFAGRFKETLVKGKAEGESGKSIYGRRSFGREHDARDVRARDGSRSAKVRQRASERKDVPCRYYARGYCKRKDLCEFRHR